MDQTLLILLLCFCDPPPKSLAVANWQEGGRYIAWLEQLAGNVPGWHQHQQIQAALIEARMLRDWWGLVYDAYDREWEREDLLRRARWSLGEEAWLTQQWPHATPIWRYPR